MGIYVGSGSVKPYVGGTEIKEAYVGSELVYQSKLPYVYYFLGAENDYVINPNCALTRNAAVVKNSDEGLYNLVIAYNLTSDIGGVVTLNDLSDYVGKTFQFTYKFDVLATSTSTATARIRFYNNNTVLSTQTVSGKSADERALFNFTVPNNCNKIIIDQPDGTTNWQFKLNDIRFMLE